MNHDCRPNAHYYFDTQTLTQHVHAIRTIYPGEELTISYTDPSQTREERQDALHRSWGFRCSCSLCTQPRIITDASDARINQIEQLREELADFSPNGRGTPQKAELMVSLHEQERMHAPIATAYAHAALEWNGIGDAYRAIKYAHLALESGLLYGGPKDTDVIEMVHILRDPSEHWSWMMRMKGPLREFMSKD